MSCTYCTSVHPHVSVKICDNQLSHMQSSKNMQELVCWVVFDSSDFSVRSFGISTIALFAPNTSGLQQGSLELDEDWEPCEVSVQKSAFT